MDAMCACVCFSTSVIYCTCMCGTLCNISFIYLYRPAGQRDDYFQSAVVGRMACLVEQNKTKLHVTLGGEVMHHPLQWSVEQKKFIKNGERPRDSISLFHQSSVH